MREGWGRGANLGDVEALFGNAGGDENAEGAEAEVGQHLLLLRLVHALLGGSPLAAARALPYECPTERVDNVKEEDADMNAPPLPPTPALQGRGGDLLPSFVTTLQTEEGRWGDLRRS